MPGTGLAKPNVPIAHLARRPLSPSAQRREVTQGKLVPYVPAGSNFETEADAIADVLYPSGVPEGDVLKERIAAHTSENFWLSAELLRDHGVDFERFLVVQKPYTERRTLATARTLHAGG
jgi:uncharacterized SAM-binding protein YcdF (DUF218 family)